MTIREVGFSPVHFRIDPLVQSPLVLTAALSRTFFPSAQVDGAPLALFSAGLRVSTKKEKPRGFSFRLLII